MFQIMDTFICGACQSSFNNIDLFVQHKQAGCAQTTQEIIQVHLHDTQEVNSADQVIGACFVFNINFITFICSCTYVMIVKPDLIF